MKHKHMKTRRWLGVPLLAWVVIAGLATVAAALLFSRQTTAPDTATARSIGAVDIGDAATQGIFAQSLSDVIPGSSFESCIRVQIGGQQPVDVAALYTGTIDGPLADDLTFTVQKLVDTAAPSTGSGIRACGPASNYATPIYDGTLQGFATAHPDFTGGVPFGRSAGHPGMEQFRFVLGLPAETDPVPLAGQTATFSVVFENQSP